MDAGGAVGVEAVGLVYDEHAARRLVRVRVRAGLRDRLRVRVQHAARRLVEERVGLLLRLAERGADQIRGRGEDHLVRARVRGRLGLGLGLGLRPELGFGGPRTTSPLLSRPSSRRGDIGEI